jgi:D-sedoheptulose 7-phosphate isomerase
MRSKPSRRGKAAVLRQWGLRWRQYAPTNGTTGSPPSLCERDSWPGISLTFDPTTVLAAGNDYGFERVFERPLHGLGRPGDVLFGITTSSRSANVIAALRAARQMGIATVGLLGGSGSPAKEYCDHALIVPDTETARVQECHIALGHAVLELLEERLLARPLTRPPIPTP